MGKAQQETRRCRRSYATDWKVAVSRKVSQTRRYRACVGSAERARSRLQIATNLNEHRKKPGKKSEVSQR